MSVNLKRTFKAFAFAVTVGAAVGIMAPVANAMVFAVLDFGARADLDGESSIEGDKLFFDGSGAFDGVNVLFEANSTNNAYLDASVGSPPNTLPGGLGVCSSLTTAEQCTPSSDDNVSSGEAVKLTFFTEADDTAQETVDFAVGQFRDANHAVIATDSQDTLKIGINGAAATSITFEDALTTLFEDVMNITFEFDGTQFYVTVAAALEPGEFTIPIPAAFPMLAGGLGLLGLLGWRRRRTVAA